MLAVRSLCLSRWSRFAGELASDKGICIDVCFHMSYGTHV